MAGLEKDALERMERAENAGAVVHYLWEAKVRGEQAGLTRAYEERDKALATSRRKFGEVRVRNNFYEFRSVAHLWCARFFTSSSISHTGPRKYSMREAMQFFLAVAEHYRRFGEEWRAPRRKDPEALVPRQYPDVVLRSTSKHPRVPMVQPTDTRNRDDLPHLARLNRPLFWSVLCESKMRSVNVVIVNVRPDHAPKLALVDRDHVVQAICP